MRGKAKKITNQWCIHTFGGRKIIMITTIYEAFIVYDSNKIMFNRVIGINHYAKCFVHITSFDPPSHLIQGGIVTLSSQL